MQMNIKTELLIHSLSEILKTKAETEEKNKTVTATFTNPSGGASLRCIDDPQADFSLIYNKTPHYYPQDTFSLKRMQNDVSAYATGATARIDFTDNNGTESRSDRIVKTAEAEVPDLSSLRELCVRVGLLRSYEFENLMAGGGTVNVHFWNSAKDFRYRQIGDDLKKM